MKRALLLDFYGTLVHEDDEIIPVICNEILLSATVRTSAQDIARFWYESFFSLCNRSRGTTFIPQREIALRALTDTVNRFGAPLDPALLASRQFAHWMAPPMFPDARPFLEYLAKQHIPVCIVSNIDREDIEHAMTFHDLRFAHLITSDDVLAYKPHPAMFESALDTLGLAPSEVIHVGDSRTSDVAGAQGTRIPAVWLNRAGNVWQTDRRPDFTIRTLDELPAIIEGRRESITP